MRSFSFALLLVASPLVAQTQFASLPRAPFPSVNDRASRVAAADFDLDGDVDLAIAVNAAAQSLRLLLNDGRGGFVDASSTLPPLTGVNAWNVSIGRLNADPWPDIFLSGFSKSVLLINTRRNAIFQDVSATNLPSSPARSYGAAIADIDRDGDRDIVAASGTGLNQLLLNDGSGKFTLAPSNRLPNGPTVAWDVKLADVDGDGYPDLIFGITGSSRTLLYMNKNGSFVDETATRIPANAAANVTREVLVGDVDGDKDLDLLVVAYRRQDLLLINDGKGKFADETATRLPSVALGGYGGAFADIDEDGDLDAVIANYSSGAGQTPALYLNDGTGRFALGAARLPSMPSNALDIAVGDFDRDRDVDLAYARWAGASGVLHNLEGQLYATSAPQVGKTWDFDVHAQPGYAKLPQSGVIFLGVGELSPRAATPWGALGILPPLFVGPGFSLAPPGGKRTISIPIPNQASLRGVQLWWQGIHSHPPIDVRLTNVWVETIQ